MASDASEDTNDDVSGGSGSDTGQLHQQAAPAAQAPSGRAQDAIRLLAAVIGEHSTLVQVRCCRASCAAKISSSAQAFVGDGEFESELKRVGCSDSALLSIDQLVRMRGTVARILKNEVSRHFRKHHPGM